MQQPTDLRDGAAPTVALISIVEGPELQPESAFLAGAARLLGFVPQRVATDFGTPGEVFQAELTALEPAGVLLPYTTEFREVLLVLAEIARDSVGCPVALVGDGIARERLPEHPIDGVTWIAGDPGRGLAAAVGAPPNGGPAHETIAMDFLPYGPDLARRPMVASLFGEMGTVGLVATRAARSELSPVVLLARLQAPVGDDPVLLQSDIALAPLESLGDTVRRVEWWDAHATDHVLACAASLSARGVRQSVRIRPDLATPDLLATLSSHDVDRVVFDVDRIPDAPSTPGSRTTAEELEPWVAAARAAGLEVGLMVVVGLPYETAESGRQRLAAVRGLEPDRIRCVPFEPTGGTPAHDWVEEHGLLASKKTRWERELHRPLVQDCLPPDAFWQTWSDTLCYLAEVEARSVR